MNTLKFIIKSQLKRPSLTQSDGGFTLIELLVGLLLAFLVLIPLLDFMVGTLRNDRQEQAKAASEQELQAALEYISRDLQQAVYIYDNDGLTRDNNSKTPTLSGIRNQIPPVQSVEGCDPIKVTCIPILVFWKRTFKKQVITTTQTTCTSTNCSNDAFVYSLVGYYIITDKSGNSISTWSKVARIGRFEVRDGVKDSTGKYLANQDPDPGFNPPLDQNTSGDLKTRLDQWTSSGPYVSSTSSIQMLTLVDYIDKTPLVQGKKPLTSTGDFCQIVLDPNKTYQTASNPSATSTAQFVGYPQDAVGMKGFYACVDSSNPGDPSRFVTQIYLKGNAFARLGDYNSTSPSAYFPMTTIKLQGRGFLNAQ